MKYIKQFIGKHVSYKNNRALNFVFHFFKNLLYLFTYILLIQHHDFQLEIQQMLLQIRNVLSSFKKQNRTKRNKHKTSKTKYKQKDISKSIQTHKQCKNKIFKQFLL